MDINNEESVEYSNMNNKLNILDKNNKSSNFIIQNKYDELYKEYFNIKTKYEINKNNMNILQKKLKQKNHDISQMKKILLSNKQQIHFLSALKDSNTNALKDNEVLITNLKLEFYISLKNTQLFGLYPFWLSAFLLKI